MNDILDSLRQPYSQADFARLLGRSEGRVSQWVGDGTLLPGGTALEWLHAVLDRISDEAAGRHTGGPLDLSQERAELARAQRIGQELKNAIAQGEYAPVGLLTDVLATASAAIVDRLDSLGGVLRKACPDLPPAARDAIERVHVSARNEWIRATGELVIRRIDELQAEAEAAAETDEAGE